MILPKYYCENCKKFKARKDVDKKAISSYWGISFRSCNLRCKWCHNPVLKSEDALEAVMRDYFEWKDQKRKQYEIKLFTKTSYARGKND